MVFSRTAAPAAPDNTASASPSRPRLSDEAANIGQRIINLEDALTQVTSAKDELAHNLAISEGENQRLKTSLIEQTRKSEYFMRIYAETETKLQVAGKIILDALRHEEPEVAKYRPKEDAVKAAGKIRAATDSVRAVSAALEDDGRDVPKFLTVAKHEDKITGRNDPVDDR